MDIYKVTLRNANRIVILHKADSYQEAYDKSIYFAQFLPLPKDEEWSIVLHNETWERVSTTPTIIKTNLIEGNG